MMAEMLFSASVMLSCLYDSHVLAEEIGGGAKAVKAGNYIHGHWCYNGQCLDPHGDEHQIGESYADKVWIKQKNHFREH